MSFYNALFDTDGYKPSHSFVYPKDVVTTHHYLGSRGGLYNEYINFGAQMILREMEGRAFTEQDVRVMDRVMREYGVMFDTEGAMYIAKNLQGRLPVRVMALPEGMLIPTGTPQLIVEGTDHRVPWIAGYIETALLRVWYPSTVATVSFMIKRDLKKWHLLTSDAPLSALDYKLHDFGSRGASSPQSAERGGLAHLTQFKGTDTLLALFAAEKYYGATELAGHSINATEHSTICAYGRENELEAYRQVLRTFGKPGAIFACVSDAYDIMNAVSNLWGGELRQEVIDSGATIVVRPDSGEPVSVVLEVLQRLDAAFGHTLNSKGYRVLNHVRVIQGDGVNQGSINDILKEATDAGYSLSNLAFGMGGALLQKLDRDTLKYAMKCSAVARVVKNTWGEKEEVWSDVYKSPVHDKSKASIRGRVDDRRMDTVFLNGTLYSDETLDAVRARSLAAL